MLSTGLMLFSSSSVSSSLFLFTTPGLFSSLMPSSSPCLSNDVFMFSILGLISLLMLFSPLLFVNTYSSRGLLWSSGLL